MATTVARPTHFLCLPLGQSSALTTPLSTLGSSLLRSDPLIQGLDPSVIIKPERLHLTLGVMPLRANSASGATTHTVGSALKLLCSLSGPISHILNTANHPRNSTGNLSISFAKLDIMSPPRGTQKGDAHVLWVGPSESSLAPDPEYTRLLQVCDFVHSTFRKEGFIQETRPLKLHCTIINTVYRRNIPAPISSEGTSSKRFSKKSNQRVPFSYTAITQSPVLSRFRLHSKMGANEILAPTPSLSATASTVSETVPTPHPSSRRGKAQYLSSIEVNLGTYPISSIQICEMGSHDEKGEYKSVGEILL